MFWFYMLLVPLLRAHGDVIYSQHGDNVTLPCFYSSDAKYLGWYKQVAGEQPQIVSSFYKHVSNIFHEQFKGNKRFSVQTGNGHYNLSIYEVQDSDSALYYCGSTGTSMMTQFDRALFLVLKNCSCPSFLQQPDSDSVQPGGSVTLNCTVLTGTRDGERRVYWFKKEPGMSDVGVLYTDAQSSHQCGRRFKNGANSCVFSFTRRNVSQWDAGMYHCAVASCGQVLFGAGTRLNIGAEVENPCPRVQVYGVAAGLVGSLILNIILLTVVCKMSRGKYLQSEGSQQEAENPTTENVELSVVEYTALDFKLRPDTSSSRQRDPQEETIYSRVRPSQLQ